ncbi:glycosyl hydrolase family protein [Anopheles sinensis]|uniref:Glycosyl hydrolase family protein n=1 Tax=Anopheles sinensis TaxID=74873 RepID=A0A084VHI8_ANOSI|nr:glycosyl hydrolase family protein [Anopheles sinensis]
MALTFSFEPTSFKRCHYQDKISINYRKDGRFSVCMKAPDEPNSLLFAVAGVLHLSGLNGATISPDLTKASDNTHHRSDGWTLTKNSH